MDNACIIGYGVVGQATAEVFGIKKYFDLNGSTVTLEEAAKCKFVFICLPTNFKEGTGYDTADIEAIIKQLEDYGGAGIYVLRSTVRPGYAQNLMEQLSIDRIVSNPEFLTEATAQTDSRHPPFILLGGAVPTFINEVEGLYLSRFKGSPVIKTDNITAEMAKLAMNAYFATKVTFANQIFDACQALGANYERVKEVLESHPFGPKNHFEIFHKGYRGFGGKCLPKDTKALAHYTNLDLLKKIVELNEGYLHP